MKTPISQAGMRPVICIIGDRNVGKSSLINALLNQEISIVSNTKGTTTDAISKAYELTPFGPVTFYDTAGLDDSGELGQKRIEATKQIIKRADLIIYVIGKNGIDEKNAEKIKHFHLRETPIIPVFNFADEYQLDERTADIKETYNGIIVSAKTRQGLEELKEKIIEKLSSIKKDTPLLNNIIKREDTVVLVTPIDASAPKGRLIMPQVETLREVIDNNATAVVTQTSELRTTFEKLNHKPNLVVTDSQSIKEVSEITPKDVPLTTFSMLYANQKGDFKKMIEGAKKIDSLQNNDIILIVEGCSHHTTCEDIGRVKIPNLIRKYTQKELNFEFCIGHDFPEDLTKYSLVIHCGGCVITRREIQNRIYDCDSQEIPITNYGILISKIQGVLERTSKPLL